VKKTFAISLLSLLWCFNSAYAQNDKKKDSPIPKVTTPNKAVNVSKRPVTLAPFSHETLDSGRLKVGYTGLPPESIANALEKIVGIKKGEFETTEKFEARKAAQLSSPYIPNLALTDIHAFTSSVDKADYSQGISYRYDADTQTVAIMVSPLETKPNHIGGKDYSASTIESIQQQRNAPALDVLSLSSKTLLKNSYVASNAYGAKVVVEKTTSIGFSLGLDQIAFVTDRNKYGSPSSSPLSQFKLEPTKAAKELTALKALFIVKLVEPYLDFHFIHIEPKRDSPTEMLHTSYLIRGTLLEVAIYSGLTGEIFARIPSPKTE